MRPSASILAVLATLLLLACQPQPVATMSPPRAPCLADRTAPAAAPSTAGMVLVRGGVFTQGARGMRAEEGPERSVTIGDFWIDATEVTNADFARFVAATGYVTMAERPLDPAAYPDLPPEALKPSGIVFVGAAEPNGSDPGRWWRVVQGADWRHPTGPGSSIEGREHYPVVQIAWDDALAYTRWLGRDLPTEAEWEYAAQGGKAASRYVWGDTPLDREQPQANVWEGTCPTLDLAEDGYKAEAAPVGCFPANGFGLRDMAGNVWEWTRDYYRPRLPEGAVSNPAGPPAEAALDPSEPGVRKHVIKGGSFLCSPNYCYRYRPAARAPGPSDTGENHIGFRTVLRPARPLVAD